MVELPGNIKAGLELEPRIATMAPAEPNLVRLLEALRLLESSWGEDLDIVVDVNQDGHGYLRRTFRSGKMTTNWNVGIKAGKYVNACMTGADQYETIFPDFVAAAFGFGGRVQPSVAAAAFNKVMTSRQP
jgi:hypothetical protein